MPHPTELLWTASLNTGEGAFDSTVFAISNYYALIQMQLPQMQLHPLFSCLLSALLSHLPQHW